MSSTITRVMAIRVKNETYEFFKGKPLNRVVESVHKEYKEGHIGIKEDGEVFVSSRYEKWRRDNDNGGRDDKGRGQVCVSK